MVVNNHQLTIKRRYHKMSAWYYICNVEFLCITVFIMFIVCVNLLESTYLYWVWSFADGTNMKTSLRLTKSVIDILQKRLCSQMKIIWYNGCFTMLNWTHDQELQLLVSSVFAWQAAIQSTGADTCECTDALLLAFCTPARMDWLYRHACSCWFKSRNGLRQNPNHWVSF